MHNQKYNNGKATYTKGITQFTDMVCLINILNYNNILLMIMQTKYYILHKKKL